MLKRGLITFIMALILSITGCGTDDAANDTSGSNPNNDVTETVNDDANNNGNDHENDNAEAETDASQNAGNDDTNEHSANNADNANEQADIDDLEELSVHYIDAGQADATLFQYADDDDAYTILFDTGDWGRNDVVRYLDSQDVSSIDLVATSHPHSDHIGQLAEIVDTYDVGEVWMSGNETSSQTFQGAIQAVDESGADFHEPRTGEEFSIGPMDITILYPDCITGDLNEESVSMHMSYGDVDFVFTGDAEQGAEASMVQSDLPLDADILQLGHHGSNTSSTPAFIEAVDPDTAIYSAGADNQYGHPDAEVVDRIQDADIDLYGTDVNGTIVINTDGKSYEVLTDEDGTISPDSTGSAQSESADTHQFDDGGNNQAEESQSTPSTDGCVDINHASSEELENIIHIGPDRSDAIIDARPFDSVDELTRINGIADSRIADIKQENVACVK